MLTVTIFLYGRHVPKDWVYATSHSGKKYSMSVPGKTSGATRLDLVSLGHNNA